MIKQLTALLLCLLSGAAVLAQKGPEITFEQSRYDFGQIKEEDGPVEHAFSFTNTGDAPLLITSVKASCGCTTPGWTSDAVPPGERGFIKAQYNPLNRPGNFNKSLTVKTNTSTETHILFIEGFVKPKPRTPEEDYPVKNGQLRTANRAFYMGNITTEEPVTKEFELFNDSESDTLVFRDQAVTPDYIQLTFIPERLAPNTVGRLIVSYDPATKNDLGFRSDNIVFFTDEEENSNKSFTIMATVYEYFPPMTKAELEKAPKLVVDKRLHDFGNLRSGEVVKTSFKLVNTGNSPLNIRQTKANCGCTVSKPGKKDLAPGESTTLEVTFNPEGRVGNQQKNVTIFSNDPQNPNQIITIKASVASEAGL